MCIVTPRPGDFLKKEIKTVEVKSTVRTWYSIRTKQQFVKIRGRMEAYGETETYHLGYLGAQYYMAPH
jgi:hypothetical protein